VRFAAHETLEFSEFACVQAAQDGETLEASEVGWRQAAEERSLWRAKAHGSEEAR
jgi:hypothetical protein